MAEETTLAASSPAEDVDVFNGEQPSLSEFSHYRETGELPERFKTAEEAASTPADESEETTETESEEVETETEEAQEQPQKGSGAEKRIKQLLAKIKELETPAAKQDVHTESSPASAPQYTRPKPTAEDKAKDGTLKYGTYEDFVEDLADWKAEQRWETAKREQQQLDAQKALKSKVDEARTRYDDVDEVIFPAAKTIHEANIPLAVKEVFAGSELFIDLCYVVGSDPDAMKEFISLAQSNPRAAIGKVFEYERRIREELDGKDEKKAPETKKTGAPKPPSPVSGASSRAFDVSDESLSADEWARKRTADIAKRKT
jgi:chemotaxis protein histidine kinase CheA